MKKQRRHLSGWGNFRPGWCDVVTPRTKDEFRSAIGQTAPSTWISRGMGRSYGDSAVNSGGLVIDHTSQSALIHIDSERHTARVQAGMSLGALIGHILPKGLFLPVSPGTKFVTVGGAVAADIHGKNHHREGSFGSHVDELSLLLPGGEIVTCGPSQNSKLFYATIGGMGLTGAILDVTIRCLPVESAHVRVESHRTGCLEETLELLNQTANTHRYSVSWIDALSSGRELGRGWVLAGEHAEVPDLPESLRAEPYRLPTRPTQSVPFHFPGWVLNRWSCGLFNDRVYRRGIVSGNVVDIDSFFYPLDRVHHWNRIYGRAGFIQYQALFPFESSATAIRNMLELLHHSGQAAFFAGLKSAGPASGGLISFLSPGFTVGLDLPYRKGLDSLVEKWDRLVIEAGGRIYLAKDSLLSAESFREMYPQWKEFMAIRKEVDPKGMISSNQSRRLGLDG